jgi:hypothetical protein
LLQHCAYFDKMLLYCIRVRFVCGMYSIGAK